MHTYWGGIITISKGGKVYMSSKKVNQTFRRISGNAFGQGIWRAPTNFASWPLIMPFVCSSNQKVEGVKQSESVIKPAK